MAKIRTFNVNTRELKDDEKQVIKILTQVGKEIHKMWEKQVEPSTGRITLYDEGITRAEVIKAAETNPDVLSPYTVVRRAENGTLFAVPYSEEYKEGIAKIVELFKQVERISRDGHFRGYVAATRKGFERGDFDASLIAYLNDGRSKIGFLIGPIETYLDKLMGIKKVWQFNLRVMRDADTDEVQKMINVSRNMPVLRPHSSVGTEVKENMIKMRVDDVLMFSGRQAGTISASTNLPNEANLVKRHGTKIVVYKNSLETRFAELYTKHLRSIENPGFKFNMDRLKDASARLTILHEISEALVKFPDAGARLKGDENAMSELKAYVMAVKSAQYDMLAGIITQQEYNEILIMLMVAGLDKSSRMGNDPSIYEYARGFAVLFNYLKKVGAMKLKGKKVSLNLDKFTGAIDSLASVVVSIYHEGTYEDSQAFFQEYGSFKIMDKMPLRRS